MELPIMIIRHGAAHYDYKTLFMKSTIDEYIYIYSRYHESDKNVWNLIISTLETVAEFFFFQKAQALSLSKPASIRSSRFPYEL